MRKSFWLAVAFVGLTAVAGCSSSSDPNAEADVEGERSPLAGPSTHTLNSPTTGPTSSGLSGGTEESAPPDLVAPDRGTIVR